MLLEEAAWLGTRLAAITDADLFPLANIGSSTGRFRSVTQPHINRAIFCPLGERRGPVHHVDIKAGPGVDVVGDLENPDFIAYLRGQLAPQSLLVSNLLEHVRNPSRVAHALLGIVPHGGLIIVSGPHRYPYHPDPIDTRFRPSLEEAHALFPGTRLVDGEIVVSNTWRPWGAVRSSARSRMLYFGRLALPVYRPKSWRRRLDSVPYILRRVSAYAMVLVKDSS